MRKWISLVMCLAAGLPASVSQAHEETAGSLPMKVAVLPFRCVKACEEMQTLQGALEFRALEDSVFELLMTRETEDIFLALPRFRSAFDSLTARVSRGLSPDSATAMRLCRRLHVDGLLYGYMTDRGPCVEVWSMAPSPSVVFRYAAEEERRGRLPESRHEGADTKRPQPLTGGANSTNATTGATTHTEGTAEMPKPGNAQQSSASLGNSSFDDRSREMSEIISRRLRELRNSGKVQTESH